MKTKVKYTGKNKELLRRAARETHTYLVNAYGNRGEIVHENEFKLEAVKEVYEDLTGETLITK